MSEDKIIEIVKDFISYIRFDEKPKYGVRQQYIAIENLLDLYQKEKEKNKEAIQKAFEDGQTSIVSRYISKDKIRAKIKELKQEVEKERGTKGLRYSQSGFIQSKINILNELLEEE